MLCCNPPKNGTDIILPTCLAAWEKQVLDLNLLSPPSDTRLLLIAITSSENIALDRASVFGIHLLEEFDLFLVYPFEEFDLCLRRSPSEGLVSGGKPAEAPNYPQMQLR